jgi:hypothetical protein
MSICACAGLAAAAISTPAASDILTHQRNGAAPAAAWPPRAKTMDKKPS